MDTESARRLADLGKNTSLALGRLNAVHMLMVAWHGSCHQTLLRCAQQGREARARIEADLVTTSLPESMLNEMQRVMDEGIKLFELAAKQSR